MDVNPFAFPVSNDANNNGQEGMSLRDWFAGMALQANVMNWGAGHEEHAAKLSYAQADAMLAERQRQT